MVRLNYDTCDLIPADLVLEQSSGLTLSEKNIEKIDISYDTVDDIVNKYLITKEGWPGTGIFKNIPSIQQYEEKAQSYTLQFHSNVDQLIKWLDLKAHIWAEYELASFINALFTDQIVPNSAVNFQFTNALNFLDSDQGNLIKQVPPVWEHCGGNLYNGIGFVEELSIDPGSWAVNLTVRLPKKLGEGM